MIREEPRSIKKRNERAATKFTAPVERAYRQTFLAVIEFLQGMVAALASLLIPAFSRRILEFAKLDGALQGFAFRLIEYASFVFAVILLFFTVVQALRHLVPAREHLIKSKKVSGIALWIAAQQRADRTIISLPKGVDVSTLALPSDDPDNVVEVLEAPKEIEG